MHNEKVVVIGGGTGLSTLLKGIKKYTPNITAVVTVADNGGGSGKIREEMGIIPPGDIRNCLVALANTEPIMKDLLQYRFTEGSLKNQSFGNLLLAALTGVTGSFENAVHEAAHVLAITGKVLPVTLENVHLYGTFDDGSLVIGECEIVDYGKTYNSNITHIELCPRMPKPNQEVLTAIAEADKIILGPGSLYTSIIPNLLVDEVATAITHAKCEKIYIANIMTQPGETTNCSLERHIEILEQYLGQNNIDTVIVNNEEVDDEAMLRYRSEGSEFLKVQENHPIWNKLNRIEASLVKKNPETGVIRHDQNKLAKAIFRVQ